MPNISAQLCDFVQSAAKTDFVINPQIIRTNSQLWNWLSDRKIIRQPANIADKVICNGCEKYCYMDVESTLTNNNKTAYFIACDKRDDVGFIMLDSNEVRPHNFNMLAFCNMIASKMNSHDEVKTLIPGSLYKIGRCTFYNNGLTFFLAISADDINILPQHVEYKQASKPVIISLDKQPANSLPIVYLDSLIIIDDSGNLEIFHENITNLYSDEPAIDKNIFRNDGAVWLVCYKGKQARIKHTKGMYYIKELLFRPNAEIKSIDLQAIVDKPPASQDEVNDEYRNMSLAEIENEGLAVHVESPDDIIDEELLAVYRTNLKTIDTDIAEAESKGMTTRASQLKKQKVGMEEFIRKNTNIKGKSRKVPDASEKARQAVAHAISTAVKNISAELPELSLHLTSHISKGHIRKYTPEENLNWQF